jgi:formylglycine-generating enzyme required for sulfatase activity/cytochrome c553
VDVFDNLVPLVEDPLYGVLEAIPLRPRVRPPIIPSLVEPRQREASILVADVYRGPGLRGVPRGTVKGLRIYGFEYAYQGMSGWAAHGNNGGIDRRILLGTARVEADGSAHFLLPANLPVAVQPIDGQGRAIQTMRSWYTAMPGERGACVGCHEPMSDTAPLRAVRAGLRPPEAIAPWHGPARRFDFNREVVRPVLSRHCASCHDLPGLPRKKGKEPPPPRLEQAFLLKYTRHIGQESDLKLYPPGEWYADAAELIQMLRKGHQGVLLSEEDFARLTTWLDLNAPGSGTWPQPTNAQMERRRVLQAVYEGHGDAALFEAGPLPPFAEPLPPNPDRDAPETPIKLPGWPFDAGEARRKQRASGAEVSLHIPVGANSEGKPIVLEMVRIPAGRFVMGEAAGPRDEKPATVVEITKPFWMATTEVTNELYQLFDPEHDSYRYDGRPTFPQQEEHIGPLLSAPRQPVVRVNWERARAFCKWLSAKTGRRFDLPTEAQWEWACRAGGDGPFWYGDHTADFASFANLADLSFAPKSGRGGLPGPARIYDQRFNDGALVSAPVGQYAANPWGLHDMHGNVAEWTRSAYRPYPYADNDGRNNDDLHEDKVIRGGSWHDRPRRATAAFRNYRPAWMGAFDVGFRVICEGD